MSSASERWRANWDDAVAMTQISDEAGFEFILPVAKWRCFQGKPIATIDHVTHGRTGLNIVCGWNQEEFDLHGFTIDRCPDGTFTPKVIASAPSAAHRSSRRTAPMATEKRRQCAPGEAQSSMTSV